MSQRKGNVKITPRRPSVPIPSKSMGTGKQRGRRRKSETSDDSNEYEPTPRRTQRMPSRSQDPSPEPSTSTGKKQRGGRPRKNRKMTPASLLDDSDDSSHSESQPTQRRSQGKHSSSPEYIPEPSTTTGRRTTPRKNRDASGTLNTSAEPSTSGTEPSSTTGNGVSTNLSTTAEFHEGISDQLVVDCALYILMLDCRKLPVKKPDIIKSVFKDEKKQFNAVMDNTAIYLNKVAGLHLHRLEDNKAVYILVNGMAGAYKFPQANSKLEKMKMGLLMIVLTIIFMKDDYLTEENLWKYLMKFGIDPDSGKQKHAIFGDVVKLMTNEFVKQLYLEYKKTSNDPPCYVFSWGSRAKLEMSKYAVLKFVTKVCETLTPKHFPHLYEEAVAQNPAAAQEEEERERENEAEAA